MIAVLGWFLTGAVAGASCGTTYWLLTGRPH